MVVNDTKYLLKVRKLREHCRFKPSNKKYVIIPFGNLCMWEHCSFGTDEGNASQPDFSSGMLHSDYKWRKPF